MAIGMTLIEAPAIEPLTLATAKNHLRVDLSDDDTLITTLITVARRVAERSTNRALITQTWELVRDYWPRVDYIELPRSPLQSVTSVIYTDTADAQHTLDTSIYLVDTDHEPGRVALKFAQIWPTTVLQTRNGIRIRFVAGYGGDASDVPGDITQAMLLLIGHWYENRETINIGNIVNEIPLAASALLGMNEVPEIP